MKDLNKEEMEATLRGVRVYLDRAKYNEHRHDVVSDAYTAIVADYIERYGFDEYAAFKGWD